MKKDDTCYYMSITKEENSAFVVHQNQNNANDTQVKEGEDCCLFVQEKLENQILITKRKSKVNANI